MTNLGRNVALVLGYPIWLTSFVLIAVLAFVITVVCAPVIVAMGVYDELN